MSKTQQAVDYLSVRTHYATVPHLLFLADWHHCIHHNRQITDLQWVHAYGLPAAELPNASPLSFWQHIFGRPRSAYNLLTAEERASLDHAVEATRELDRRQIATLVLSTYPCFNRGANTQLNLPAIAAIYRTMNHDRTYCVPDQDVAA